MSTPFDIKPQPASDNIVPPEKSDPPGFYPSSIAGNVHGTVFNDELDTKILQSALIGIRVRHGYKVDSVQCIYSLKGKTFDGPHHGGSGGGESVFWLLDGEYIIGFQGRSGYELDAIQFFTSRGRQTPYYGGGGGGGFGGDNYAVNPVYPKSGLQYFSGSYGYNINSIQAHWAEEVPPR